MPDIEIKRLSKKIIKYRKDINTLNEKLKNLKVSLNEANTLVKKGGGGKYFPVKTIAKTRTVKKPIVKKTHFTLVPNKTEPKTENEIVILVLGMGCDEYHPSEYLSKGTDIDTIALNYSNLVGRKCIILCEQDRDKVVRNIAQIATNIGGPTQKLVDRVYDKLLDLLINNEVESYSRIDIVGHSYGGGVVSKMLEMLNDNIDEYPSNLLNKCHVHTIGSIYIPKAINTLKLINNGMKINHYMFQNDVALKVKKPPKSANITWLGYSKPSRNVFGTKAEWAIHNDHLLEFLTIAITNKLEPSIVKEEMNNMLLKKSLNPVKIEATTSKSTARTKVQSTTPRTSKSTALTKVQSTTFME